MAEADTIEPGTVLAGRYRVERRLGEGGMGSVFLVQHMHTDQNLAVKVLHSTVVKDAVTLDRFRREARAPARIQSDHVVQVTDADVAPELGGVPFLVMEWLRGEDLGQISERGPVHPEDVVLYLRQAARALDKAHGLGIVHRDLKPENLFLTAREDGTPWLKLLDFGIAKLTLTGASGDLEEIGSITSTGQVFGTPLYMSPEQAKAEVSAISPQTDVWALGLIAYRLLFGREIWNATTLTHLIAQIAYEPMPVPSDRGSGFGPAFDAWFLRCCARAPADRYPSAGEAVTALADALGVTESALSASGDVRSGSGRISRPSHSGLAVRGPAIRSGSKFDDTVALAATAHDTGRTAPPPTAPELSDSGVPYRGSAGDPKDAVAPAITLGRAQPRLPIAAGIVVALVVLGFAIWLVRVMASPSASVDPTDESPRPGDTSGARAADVRPSVTVSPSPGGDLRDPSPGPAATSSAAPSASAADPQANAGSTVIPSGKPLPVLRPSDSSTKPPAGASGTPTSRPASPGTTVPPSKTVNDPLSTRH